MSVIYNRVENEKKSQSRSFMYIWHSETESYLMKNIQGEASSVKPKLNQKVNKAINDRLWFTLLLQSFNN